MAKSGPPPSASNRWYVGWKEENCVQDRNSKFDRLASIVYCGGIVSDASVVLCDYTYDCCAETLDWLNTTECFQRFIEVSTGWLNHLIEDLTPDQRRRVVLRLLTWGCQCVGRRIN